MAFYRLHIVRCIFCWREGEQFRSAAFDLLHVKIAVMHGDHDFYWARNEGQAPLRQPRIALCHLPPRALESTSRCLLPLDLHDVYDVRFLRSTLLKASAEDFSIKDIQSYVSRLFLLVACEGLKLVFLVDNGPWTATSRLSRPAELWQLLVHKSRRSPFANRLREYTENDNNRQRKFLGRETANTRVAAAGQEKEDGWLSLLIALQRSFKQRVQVKKPHGLYGCVAFEVAWADVRGINYSNELQTDTCVSLEAKIMTKREFDSLEQARACYDTILSGPSLSMSKGSDDKTVGALVRCKGPEKSLRRFVDESSKGPQLLVEDPMDLLCRSGIEKTHVRRRPLGRSYTSSANLISELSRAYISSLTSALGIGLQRVNPGSLPPEYFTPPSSPYNGQVLQSFFKNYSCQHKDTRRFRIVPVDEDSGQHLVSECQTPDCEIPDFEVADECESSPRNGSRINSRASADWTDSSCVPSSSSNRNKPLESSNFRMNKEGDPLTGITKDDIHCNSTSEVRLDPVYVHPDRLIAPAETYRDILIIFRFSEPLLPVELRKIITADRRLLKMLESGLQPWVIFLQSYPILCHIYRPWMRPLCGTVYYLITVVTVLIGFYDLYKNVPVLKATAAHICGPLFEWIEEWGMVSRLKYLGTMLFLQNCEKAFEWALAVTRASRQISVLLMRPFLVPLMSLGEALLPLWVAISEGFQTLVQCISTVFYSAFFGVSSILGILVWPFISFLCAVVDLGKAFLYPVFFTVWSFLALPLQLVKLLVSLLGALSYEAVGYMQAIWLGIYNSIQFFLASGSPALRSFKVAKSSTPSPSLWKTLWRDILSKVFHAVNGIVKGLAAFVTVCNRHRLSIYNQIVDCLFRASHVLRSAQFLLHPDPIKPEAGEVVETEAESEAMELTNFRSRRRPSLRERRKGGDSSSSVSSSGEEQMPSAQHLHF